MLLALLAFAAGALTILSPCILPVLPFVFTRAGQPFRSHGLPLLLGMAAMFALVGLLAALGGPWVVGANRAGRWAALALLGIFGLTLLLPGLADRLTRPLVAAGAAWSARARQVGAGADRCCWAWPRGCCGRPVRGRCWGWC
jgi:cytochrome c biogenesis protein CcdA